MSEKHGHPKVYEVLEALANLHSRKNKDYAQGGRPLGNFERRSAIYEQYPGLDLSDPVVVAMVDAMKQLDAALWMKSKGYNGEVEDIVARLMDVAGYAVIATALEQLAIEEDEAILDRLFDSAPSRLTAGKPECHCSDVDVMYLDFKEDDSREEAKTD